MIELQERGCHNINWVTPTHFVPQILDALCFAVEKGFRLPLVYNTNGYDSLETLGLLDGIVDIYLPDMKYADEGIARAYSQAPNYPTVNASAIQEMYRQVGRGQVCRGRDDGAWVDHPPPSIAERFGGDREHGSLRGGNSLPENAGSA